MVASLALLGGLDCWEQGRESQYAGFRTSLPVLVKTKSIISVRIIIQNISMTASQPEPKLLKKVQVSEKIHLNYSF